MLEKTLVSPLDCKEIQPVHPRWDQSWVFIGKTDAEAETPILWPPHANSWLIGKDPDAGRDWGQEEKGTTEDEMAGWHHRLTQRTWVWVNFRSWWWTGRPGLLWFMGSQRVGHDWATELNYMWVWFVELESQLLDFYLCPWTSPMTSLFPHLLIVDDAGTFQIGFFVRIKLGYACQTVADT